MSDSTFYRLLPDPALRRVIDSYWIINQPAGSLLPSPVFPMGYPFLEVSLNENLLVRQDQAGSTSYHQLLMGLSVTPMYFWNTGRLQSVLVRLQPWGLATLFCEAPDLNAAYDAALVFGPQLEPLRAALRSAARPEDIKILLDRFFRLQIRRSESTPDERITFAVERILQEKGNLSIAALGQELFVTQRRLEQLFKDHLGLSPKAYAAIARFQFVLAAADANRNLTQLAMEAGYYDQSHFIRQFRKFSGHPPSAVFRKADVSVAKISNLYNFAS